MASRKSGKRKKLEPAVLNMTFVLPPHAEGASTTAFLDLSQCASKLNRRFYRQGLAWYVGGFSFLSTGTGNMTVASVWNNWTTGASWEKTFRTWKKQQDDVMRDAGAESAVAKYRDFKIHMNDHHVDAGFAANMVPVDSDGTPVLAGEWVASTVVLPNAGGPGVEASFDLHMTGPDNVAPPSKGIAEGYSNSRSTPQSPDPATPAGVTTGADNWLRGMFDVGSDSDTILDDATLQNVNLPYDQDDYPGGATNLPGLEIQHFANFSATTVSQKISLPGGCFPCGLVAFEHSVNASTTVIVHLLPGEHRGYMATDMEGFN